MSERRLTRVALVVLALAVAFTSIFLFAPESIGVSPHGYSLAYSEQLFDRDQMMTVEITMPDADWDNLLDTAQEEQYSACDISINGNALQQVGIRCKGNSSLRQAGETDRYSFKIQFDEYVKGQNMLGLDKMVLNNTQGDASWMKEYLSYYTMDMVGVNVPLYAFAKVYVNGEFWGLYLALEVLEDSYILRTYGSDNGYLYKVESMEMGNTEDRMEMFLNMGFPEGGNMPTFNGELPQMPEGGWMPGGDVPQGEGMPEGGEAQQNSMMPEGGGNFGGEGMRGGGFPDGGMMGAMSTGGSNLVYVDDNLDSYSAIFANAIFPTTTQADNRRVVTALKGISDENTDISTVVDIDQMLRYIAGNAMVGNGDGYFGSMMHNFYLYEKNGKITMLPWDYNLSYGGFSGNADTLINQSIDEPVLSGSLEERPLLARLLKNDEYKAIYYTYLQTLGEFYANGEAEALVDRLNDMLREWVEKDPTKQYTREAYDAAVVMLKDYLSLRGQSILNQLAGDTTNVDASGINLQTLGSMGMGGGFGGMGGGGRNRGDGQGDPDSQVNPNGQTADENMQGMEGADFAFGQGRGASAGNQGRWMGMPMAVEEPLDPAIPWLLGASLLAVLLGLVVAYTYRKRRI